MGLFDFIKKKRVQSEEQIFVDNISKSIEQLKNAPLPEPISKDEYLEMRESEVQWLEEHYDFNSIEGIDSIRVSKNLKKPPTSGETGEVYYYMRKKAYEHEEAGKIDLAIACLRKSNQLMQLKYGADYGRTECYSLVRLLARSGYVEEAEAEKESIDCFYANRTRIANKNHFRKICQDAAKINTDLIIMSAHGATCPECAKYQGRVYSISGSSKSFPKIPEIIASTGCVHDNCDHSFHPYIHKVSDPELKYTLSVHPLKNNSYGRNIVAFSNRPFVDDRTDECTQAAIEAREKLRIKAEQDKYNEDHMIEYEAQRGVDIRNFRWLQENIPDRCPKSVSGYRRMKTQNTKNFQLLKQLASDLGRDL